MSLNDMMLVKENHIALAGSIDTTIEKLKAVNSDLQGIEVEAQTISEVEKLIDGGASRIMLDNFTVDATSEVIKRFKGKSQFESSGGITLSSVRDYALTGVDFISVGQLTHSAPAVDFSMLVDFKAK
jgi:nicotinate-nucleotide pyrophosphorylase (carboxylating)